MGKYDILLEDDTGQKEKRARIKSKYSVLFDEGDAAADLSPQHKTAVSDSQLNLRNLPTGEKRDPVDIFGGRDVETAVAGRMMGPVAKEVFREPAEREGATRQGLGIVPADAPAGYKADKIDKAFSVLAPRASSLKKDAPLSRIATSALADVASIPGRAIAAAPAALPGGEGFLESFQRTQPKPPKQKFNLDETMVGSPKTSAGDIGGQIAGSIVRHPMMGIAPMLAPAAGALGALGSKVPFVGKALKSVAEGLPFAAGAQVERFGAGQGVSGGELGFDVLIDAVMPFAGFAGKKGLDAAMAQLRKMGVTDNVQQLAEQALRSAKAFTSQKPGKIAEDIVGAPAGSIDTFGKGVKKKISDLKAGGITGAVEKGLDIVENITDAPEKLITGLGAGLSGVPEKTIRTHGFGFGEGAQGIRKQAGRAVDIGDDILQRIENPLQFVEGGEAVREQLANIPNVESFTEIGEDILKYLENPLEYIEEGSRINAALKEMPNISFENTLAAIDAELNTTFKNTIEPGLDPVRNRILKLKQNIENIGKGADDITHSDLIAALDDISFTGADKEQYLTNLRKDLRSKIGSGNQWDLVSGQKTKTADGKRIVMNQKTEDILNKYAEFFQSEEGYDVMSRMGFSMKEIPTSGDDVARLIPAFQSKASSNLKSVDDAALEFNLGAQKKVPEVSAEEFRNKRMELDATINFLDEERKGAEKSYRVFREQMRQDLEGAGMLADEAAKKAGKPVPGYENLMRTFHDYINKVDRAKKVFGGNAQNRELNAHSVLARLNNETAAKKKEILSDLTEVFGKDWASRVEDASKKTDALKRLGVTSDNAEEQVEQIMGTLFTSNKRLKPGNKEAVRALYGDRIADGLYSSDFAKKLDKIDAARKLFGATSDVREKNAESVLNNLFGANKTKRQEIMNQLGDVFGADWAKQIEDAQMAADFVPGGVRGGGVVTGKPGWLPVSSTGRSGLPMHVGNMVRGAAMAAAPLAGGALASGNVKNTAVGALAGLPFAALGSPRVATAASGAAQLATRTAKSPLGRGALGAGAGAGIGALSAPEGEKKEGALTGAAIGGLLGAGASRKNVLGAAKTLSGEGPLAKAWKNMGESGAVKLPGGVSPEDYRGVHRAPGRKYDGPGHTLGDTYPDDIYGPNGARYYGDGNEAMDNESIEVIRAMKGNPEKDVIVYRAIPAGVDDSEIHPGDWVSTSKEYASGHGERWDEGYKIIEKKVKAKDIFTEGNSIHEWGYDPEDIAAGATAAKPIYQLSASGEDYAKMAVDEVDRQAFGFASSDITSITPGKLNVKYKDDFDNAIFKQEQSGLSKKKWAKTVDLSEPIQISYENGKFFIEDGHHRYYAAKILGQKLNVDDVLIKDKPHKTAIENAIQSGKEVPEDVLKEYPDLYKKYARSGKTTGTGQEGFTGPRLQNVLARAGAGAAIGGAVAPEGMTGPGVAAGTLAGVMASPATLMDLYRTMKEAGSDDNTIKKVLDGVGGEGTWLQIKDSGIEAADDIVIPAFKGTKQGGLEIMQSTAPRQVPPLESAAKGVSGAPSLKSPSAASQGFSVDDLIIGANNPSTLLQMRKKLRKGQK